MLTLSDYLSDFNGQSIWQRVSSVEQRQLEEQRMRLRDSERRLRRFWEMCRNAAQDGIEKLQGREVQS